MEISIISKEKNSVEMKVNNVTSAEVLRVYLNEAGADFAAWRVEHPSKPIIFKIDSDKGVSKAVSSAVSAIKKDCDQLRSLIKSK